MKTAIGILIALFLLTGCLPPIPTLVSTVQAPTPIPTPTAEPKCLQGVCVKQAFVSLSNDTLKFQFDLTDPNGKVQVNNVPQFTGTVLIGVYRRTTNGSQEWVIGLNVPPELYRCYAGNDLPWTNGRFGATCGFEIPSSQTEVRLNIGDILRIEAKDFGFQQTLVVTKE